MNKVLKWILGVLIGLIGLLAVVSAFIYFRSESLLNHVYDTNITPVAIPDSPEAIERGRYLVSTVGSCNDCHGADLSGDVFLEDPMVGNFYGANLTSGKGGIGTSYTDLDWVRTIRHGIKPDGKPVLLMPSMDYYNLSDEDLGAIIAYLKTIPPVDHFVEPSKAGFLGRFLAVSGQINVVSAELINHTQPHPGAPERAATAEYGKYIASITCIGCHNPALSGGSIPGTPPEWPPAKNLTPGGDMAEWNEADFIKTIRTGMNPDGVILNPEFMPWPNFIQMTDEDLGALWAYLSSLPAKEMGVR